MRKVSFQTENGGDKCDAINAVLGSEIPVEIAIADSKESTAAADGIDCFGISGPITTPRIDRSDHNTNGIDTNDYIAAINSIKDGDTVNISDDGNKSNYIKDKQNYADATRGSSRNKSGREFKGSTSNPHSDRDRSFEIVNNDGEQFDNCDSSDDYVNDDEANQYLKGIIDSSSEEYEKEGLVYEMKESRAADDSSISKKKITLIDSVNNDDIDSDSTYDDSFECFKMVQIRDLHQKKKELYWRIVKALIDMGVSGSFIPRLPIKRVIGEGGHGLLGVISASMVIYEEYSKG
eukprot:CAMPEP_0119042236 /NCGR_PEP_ID=MMETSP1177-20130426/14465_1 /TAXON_ID=2985 /ORGANISM="Ochromonas sp, Strain CCMP1899" /LENGTH=291 /DNA_ID=CAMNT_0007008873 /DNA_START=798 /DNA_END=1673 /DNA_ORIENTATION=-